MKSDCLEPKVVDETATIREIVGLSKETIEIIKEELKKDPVKIAQELYDLIKKELPVEFDSLVDKATTCIPCTSLQTYLPFLSKLWGSQKKE
jgi:hypothetical protein